MSTISKQWLQQKIAEMEATRDEIPFGLDEDDSNTLAALRIALASLEAEPVSFVMADDLKDSSIISTPAYRDLGEAMERTVGNVVALFTAPPATVSVPDFSALDRLAGEMLTHAMNCERRVSVAYTHCAHRLAEEVRDLRALMLQGAENAESRCTIQTAPALDSSPKIAESPSGNSPVIPDDVRRMDWLVSKTVDVREPMVYGSHSIFWSQTTTDEEDDYHATKLREQIDAAMAAEQAAAPQQEVKS